MPPPDITELLLSKRLEPLSSDKIEVLRHVQDYPGVEAFNEAEVRSYIIDPILRVLGYDKGTDFSTSLENHLMFLGQQRRSDYQVHLWRENFWLLEAKKPRVGMAAFGYDDFSQALEYSVHPSVNAALIVLCDGLKLEIFDREANVESPILHVDIKDLVVRFDEVRAILEPMQIWFFQKRRILRQVDRVFAKEFVMNRVEEFSDLINRSLRGKRNVVVENFRRMIKPDSDEERAKAESASLTELTELYMMFDFPIPIDNAVNRRLVELSLVNNYHVMQKVFPYNFRPANDAFMSQACAYLVGLAEKCSKVHWLPPWLAPDRKANSEIEPAIKLFLDHCLTYFSGYEPYCIILLASCAVRRIAKINTISSDIIQQVGANLHALARFTLPEISWAQAVASREGQLINIIDTQTMAAMEEFMAQTASEDGTFHTEIAKHKLRAYWDLEKKLLSAIPDYHALWKARSLGDLRSIEWSSVTYDNLGHLTLWRLHRFPKWKDYLMSERRDLVEQVASTGSWAARQMLGQRIEDKFTEMTDQKLADRFFLGDVDTLGAIRRGYLGR